ncbi:TadE/TadG family type IV pilus assembly protein [Paenibacillus abyssi]|uniref:TadE-like domain-containing protein n=1 Tax=Paenibacillus abyssi TaxID=1340531 RepID=A0A917CV05_9BACL|nr:TadE/TadG family type IV pilus assembly protein [Paenibacillus abyssi]GGG00573.1 hypothetical protein GCM10010916_17160 [Paenibacillus abyssi]
MKRLIRENRAQSLTEFALLLPLLLLLICGIFDICRIMYGYMHLNMAVQEVVRLGGMGKTDSEVTAFAREYVKLGDADHLHVSITPNDSLRNSGEYVTVKLTQELDFLTPLISNILPAPVITAKSTTRVE